MGAFDAIRRYADEHGCLEAALLEAVLAELGASTLEVQTTIAAVVRPNKMVAVDDLEAWLDGRNVSLRQACPCLPADVDPNDPFSVAAASQFSSGAPGTAAADVVTRGLTLAPSVRGGSGAVIVPLGKGAKLPMAEAGIAARTPADGGERFVEADMPPSTPESTFFKLMASSLRTSGAAPFELANLMLDFLHSEVVASVSKVRRPKFSIKADVSGGGFIRDTPLEYSPCTVKIRFYRSSQSLPSSDCVIEFRRCSGDSVTFNDVYRRAFNYLSSNSRGEVAICS